MSEWQIGTRSILGRESGGKKSFMLPTSREDKFKAVKTDQALQNRLRAGHRFVCLAAVLRILPVG